jgi:LemA protein
LKEMGDSVMLWLAVAVLLFWAMGAYNRLVRLRSRGLSAFANLAGVFSEFIALVKTNFPAAGACPLLDAAGQPDEAATTAWSALAAAADQFKASLNAARAKPLHGPTAGALKTAFETLCLSWSRLQDLPNDSAGAAWPDSLQAEWAQLLVQTELARTDFSRTVANYNEAIGQFPALLLAALFAFRPAQPI